MGLSDDSSRVSLYSISTIFFLLLLGASIIFLAAATNTYRANQENNKQHQSVSVVNEDVDNAESGIYLGRKNYSAGIGDATGVEKSLDGSDYKIISKDAHSGDIVTRASVFTDLLALPSHVQEVNVEGISGKTFITDKYTGTVPSNAENISTLIKNGNTSEVFSAIKDASVSSYERTYVTDDDNNIIKIIYTPVTN